MQNNYWVCNQGSQKAVNCDSLCIFSHLYHQCKHPRFWFVDQLASAGAFWGAHGPIVVPPLCWHIHNAFWGLDPGSAACTTSSSLPGRPVVVNWFIWSQHIPINQNSDARKWEKHVFLLSSSEPCMYMTNMNNKIFTSQKEQWLNSEWYGTWPTNCKYVLHHGSPGRVVLKNRTIRLLHCPNPSQGCAQEDQAAGPEGSNGAGWCFGSTWMDT